MTSTALQPKLLVVFNAQIPDLQTLVAGVVEGAEVLVLDPNHDGIAQITQRLVAQPAASLHIVSHGQPGLLQLGKTQITSANLSNYAGLLRLWSSAEILLYGCEVGQGETGRNFIAQLSELTGASVAASETVTGSAALGGDWDFQVCTGKGETNLAFSTEALSAYSGSLPAGDLDTTFGTGGKVTTDFGGFDYGYSTIVQSDGKILIAGGNGNFSVARYNNDGSLDTSFGTSGKITTDFGGNDFGRSVILQADGRIIVAGIGNGDFSVARYNSDGSLDTSFGTGGKVTTDFGGFDNGYSIALQADGRIVVAGGNGDFLVARYNSDGSLDTSFGGTGKVITDFGGSDSGYSVVLQADGKIIVAGVGNGIFSVARYNSDGSLDLTFGTDGKLTTDFGGSNITYSIVLQADGKIVVAGESSNDFTLVRYNNDGDLDTSFGTGGKVITDFGGSDFGFSVALQADGKIVVAGRVVTKTVDPSFPFPISTSDFAVARYNSDGSLDTSFGTGGKVITDFGGFDDIGYSVALQADGKIVVAGFSNGDFALARYEGVSNLAPVVSAGSTNPSYSENAAATLLDSAITVADDASDFNSGSLTVRFTSGGIASDRLSVISGGSVTLDGKTVKVGGTAIGTYAGGIGSENLVISFNASATPANVQDLLRSIGYANTAEDLTNGSRTVEIIVNDGKGGISAPVSKTISVTGVNDAPIIGSTATLFDGALDTLPIAQGWTYLNLPGGITPTADAANDITNLNTSANSANLAGFFRADQVLDAAQGFVVNFNAEVLDEAIEASANKNGDSKSDRAGFSIIVVSSDKTKAIELGFNKVGGQLNIFAQEDGTSQADPSQAPNAPGGSPLTLFTQAESVLFTPTAGLNSYDLAISGNTYTLYANGTAILSGKLRDYTAFNSGYDPYETPNLIFFGDDTTSAKANINLGSVKVSTNSSLPTKTVNEDTAVAITNLYVADWDSADSLTVTLAVGAGKLNITSAGGATVTNSDSSSVTLSGSQAQINQTLSQGNLTYQGNLNFNGADTLTVSASDGVIANPVTKTLGITVTAVNDAPTSADKTIVTDEDTAYLFTTSDFTFSDVDSGDSLQKVKITQLPGAGSLTLDGSAVSADDEISVADITAGKLQFTPAANDNGTGYASFQFQVSDGTAFSASQTLTLNVTAVNDAPEISGTPDTSVRQGDSYIFAPSFDDVDGNTLTFSIVNKPAWAEFDPDTGVLSGIPTNSDVGVTQDIVISVSDGNATVELAKFNLSVDNVNDLPTISGIPDTTIAEDSFYSFTPTADDPDFGDQLSFLIVNKPAWASFDPTTGQLSGTPTNDHVGITQDIMISASDGQEIVNLAKFSLTVTNTNDAPVLSSPIADQTTAANGSFSFSVPSNSFTDPDFNDRLTLSASLASGQALPLWLSFNPQTNQFSGQPADADAGQLSIKLTATDLAGATVSDLFNLTITASPPNFPFETSPDEILAALNQPTGLPTAPIKTNQSVTTKLQGNAQANIMKGGLLTNDQIRGGGGDDTLFGGQGQAKAGRDRLYGGSGNDRLYGGSGSDLLDGGAGNDKAWGGRGRDLILGGSGNDRLLGQAGDDILNGGLGDDLLKGGSGKDMFGFASPDDSRDTIADFELSQDLIDLRQIFAAPEFAGQRGFMRFQQFVQLEAVGSNTDVKLNLDGSGFKTLATLQNVAASELKPTHFVMV